MSTLLTSTEEVLKEFRFAEYLDLMELRPELFKESDVYPIVNPKTEFDRILEFENKTGKQIGVIYKSDFHILVVDLIKGNPDFAYERVISTPVGKGVVIVPRFHGRFLVLIQFRHSIREEQKCFPRGFSNSADSTESVRKELEEELGANLELESEPMKLCSVTTDSGILSDKVDIFEVEVKDFDEIEIEGISKVEILSDLQIEDLIRDGEISDGFTILAYLSHKLRLKKIADMACWGY